MQVPVLIIGAGLTGLSCAHHLGSEYLVVEREDEPGGVARTRTRAGGFLCDGTGHWLHLRNPYTQRLVGRLMGDDMVEHERRAAIFSHRVFTRYPFQANTYGLPREIILDCVLGFLRARHPEDFGLGRDPNPPENFREWVMRQFGEGIARHFMIPYNQKLLGVGLEELMPEYAERFIPRPGTESVIRGALGFSREQLGYSARFLYPRTGGIGSLPRALAGALGERPVYGVEVTGVDPAARVAFLGDGRTVRYDWLVNTMPLKPFVSILKSAPDHLTHAASELRATTVHYFDIGVRGEGSDAGHYHWLYVPEREFIFYRVGSYSAVHRSSAPEGCRSYYVEMSGLSEAELADVEGLKRRVLDGMTTIGILASDDELLFAELATIPHAYVIFDQNYERARAHVLGCLRDHSILCGGRWGGWGYGGMEDAMLDGKDAADTIRARA
jgi:protoporphyrinogen oxidase